jgi:hypothetical protein
LTQISQKPTEPGADPGFEETSGFYFTYIDAMLLNLEAPVPQQTKKIVNLSVFKNFIKFLNSKIKIK